MLEFERTERLLKKFADELEFFLIIIFLLIYYESDLRINDCIAALFS